MPFTANSDLYVAIDEAGINLVVRHVMRQRPSLFNYGTALFLEKPDLLCRKIDAAPMVTQRQNPIISVEDPLPLPGTDGQLALNFCAQLTELQIDFHPGGVITLPPEMNPPLAGQHLAIRAQACAGIGCPTKEFLDTYQLPPKRDPKRDRERDEPKRPLVVPTDRPECFCLDLVILAHFKPAGETLDQLIRPDVDKIEIVDIRPEGLENALECVLLLLVKIVVLPKIAEAMKEIVKKPLASLLELASVTLVPTPTPAKVPNNPAVEQDQFKVFVDIEEVP